MERVSTGNPPLDLILGGGFPRNSINVIAGVPGAGKTMLAQQLAFANGPGERPALYLTTLSEPLAKVLIYLQETHFAEIERVGVDVIYDSLIDVLRQGPEALIARMRELMLEYRPRIIIIDSFKAIADLMPDTRTWRGTVFELAGSFSAYDVTVFWVGEYLPSMAENPVEFAIADGILELKREPAGSRDDRFLQVAKLRGSGFRDGQHAFRIGQDGLEVFPRLVTPPPTAPAGAMSTERLRTGIIGLDQMLENGWLRGTSTLIVGPSGAGKTLVGLHFLREGVMAGEPGLLVGFQENPSQLARLVESLGWSAEGLLGIGRLDLLYTSPVELHIDSIIQEIFHRIKHHGVRRVVVDALGDLELAAGERRRFRDYIYALTQHFLRQGITAMLTLEMIESHGADFISKTPVSQMSDNTLLLGMELRDEELVRTLRVVKSRSSAHMGGRRVLRITEKGAEVG